jgi:hypothetical protein
MNDWIRAGLALLMLVGLAGVATPVLAEKTPATAPAAPPKPPAEFKTDGAFSGGLATEPVTLTGIRFGEIDGAQRMVLDFGEAVLHPRYTLEYRLYPYRLVARFEGLRLSTDPAVQRQGALPFSLISTPDGMVRELQIFLPGPCQFKVIEVDDPAKLAIDVRQYKAEVPTVYTVQLTAPSTAAEAYALAGGGSFPDGYRPDVLVLGQYVVVEQAFTEPAAAARMDAALRDLGYACVINERRGNELPER